MLREKIETMLKLTFRIKKKKSKLFGRKTHRIKENVCGIVRIIRTVVDNAVFHIQIFINSKILNICK